MQKKLKNKIILGVDVGVNTAFTFMKNEKILKTELIKIPANTPVEKTIEDIAKGFDLILENNRVDELFIEGVGLWSSSAKSMVSASKGNTFAVAYIVGALLVTATEYLYTNEIHIVQPNEWKGNMSKLICHARIKEWFNDNKQTPPKNEHVLDSIGICLAQYGLL